MTIGIAYSGTMMGMFGFVARFRLGSVCGLALLWAVAYSQAPKLGPSVLHTNWDAKVDAKYAAIRESTFVMERMSPAGSVREAKRMYEVWQKSQKVEDLFRAAIWCRRVHVKAAKALGYDFESMKLDLYRAIAKQVAPKSYYYCREAFLLGRSCLFSQDFQYYKKLLKRDPKDWTVMRHAAMNMLENFSQEYMFGETVSLYKKIIAEGPATTDDYFYLSTAFLFHGSWKKSIKELQESLRILDITLSTKPAIDRKRYERAKKTCYEEIDIIKKEIVAKAKKGK